MVRSYILNPEQRGIIEEYIKKRPDVMSSKMRQIRMRVKRLDFDEMRSDLDLIERLNKLKIPKGRKKLSLAAGFTVAARKEVGVPAKLEVAAKKDDGVPAKFEAKAEAEQ